MKRTVFALAVTLVTAASFAAQLDIKSFSSSSYTWILDEQGLLTYSPASRSVKRAALNEFGTPDSIADVIESDGLLWVSDVSGLFKIDMETQTREAIPFPGGELHVGKLAADMDYVWLAQADSLWRYDKLANEWLRYPIGGASNIGTILGLYSSGSELFCATSTGMHVFSIADEKWYFYPVKGAQIPADARYFVDADALVFVTGSKLIRYIINSQSWDIVDPGEPIIDMVRGNKETVLLSPSHVFLYTIESSMYRPLEIYGLQNASAIGRKDTLVYVVTPKKIIEFNIPAKSMNFLKGPPGMEAMAGRKIISAADPLMIMFDEQIGILNKSMGLWEAVPLKGLAAGARRCTWDDDGLKMRWKKGCESRLTGNVGVYNVGVETQWPLDTVPTKVASTIIPDSTWNSATQQYVHFKRMHYDTLSTRIDTIYDPDSLTFLFDLRNKKASPPFNVIDRANLTLHNSFEGDRYLDLFFNNSLFGKVPPKGIYYRGNSGDRLHSVRIGTNTFEATQSPTLPSTMFEGGTVIAESKAKLESRDRKVIRSTTGAGYRISTTKYQILGYRPDGNYKIAKPADAVIIPGSVHVKIDGEEIDTTDFGFSYRIGTFNLRRRDLADRTSVISVQYDVRTAPDNPLDGAWDDVEFIPKENYGKLGYSFLSVSPREWIAPRVGYTYLDDDATQSIINAGLPVELRKNNLLFKLDPDYSYNLQRQAGAGGFGLQTRVGQNTSLIANGLLAEHGFTTTSALSKGYGAISRQLDFTLAQDIRKELPLSYSQQHVVAEGGTENRYQFNAGVHFPDLPFCDLTVSRNTIDAVFSDTVSIMDSIVSRPERDSIITDSLNEQKDKVRLRLYETSSTFGEKLLHLRKLNYELSATLLSSDMFSFSKRNDGGLGSILYGRSTITPIEGLTISPIVLYRRNPGMQPSREIQPQILLQTIDVPVGLEISGRYEFNFARFTNLDSSALDLNRVVDLIIKPGRWFKPLGWVSPLVGFEQRVRCDFQEMDPGISYIVTGNHFRSSEVLTKKVGAIIYPSDQLLFKNENRWTTVDDSLSFFTYNDLKVWVGKNNDLWQTQWKMTNKIDAHRLQQFAFSNYERRWNSTIMTRFGMNVNHERSRSITSDTNDVSRLKIFPGLTLGVATKEFLFVKTLLSNNSLTVGWNKLNTAWESRPEIGYALYLRAIFKPNISFTTNNMLAFRSGRLDRFTSNLSLLANF